MPLTLSEQLAALSDLLTARRDAILLAWRKTDRADPEQRTGRALTLGQFLDHIPGILDAYERKLRSRPGGAGARAADVQKAEEGVKDGLHRWQQSYRLKGELMDLARLEAGQEIREIAGFDAGCLIRDLCDSNQPFALERNLFLKAKGPAQISVEGDAEKVRRTANGVVVSWGEEHENWWLMVKDTGPGMLTEAGTSLADGLQEATASAKESDEESAAARGHRQPNPTFSASARRGDRTFNREAPV